MDIYAFLTEHRIEYQRHDHPAVYTVEDVMRLVPDLPGARTKNLFICDNKGKRHFLVITDHQKRLDLKALAAVLGTRKVRFASPRRLKEYLGITPGSVSLIAIANDDNKAVEVIIDRDLWDSDSFRFHPLVNTSTLVMTKPNVKRLLVATGHRANIVDVPGE